jgi:hypothetical protein
MVRRWRCDGQKARRRWFWTSGDMNNGRHGLQKSARRCTSKRAGEKARVHSARI